MSLARWARRPAASVAGAAAALLLWAASCRLPGYYGSDGELQGGLRSAWDARSVVRSAGRWDDLRFLADYTGGRFMPVSPAALKETVEEGLNRACDPRRPASDVALVIDDTASMRRFATELEATARAVARIARERTCRIALFTFRDRGDAYETRHVVRFEDGPERLADAMEAMGYQGGGDWPEAAWSAMDVASAALRETGRRGLLVLVSDAPARLAPLVTERVHERFEDERVDTLIVQVLHALKKGKVSGPVPKRPPAVKLAAVAAALGARHVVADAGALGAAVVHEIGLARAGAPDGVADVALVVDSGWRMGGRALDALSDTRETLAALEGAGGRIAIVAFRDEGDAYAARVMAPFEVAGLATRILERPRARIGTGGGGEGNETYLALGLAASLPWSRARPRAIVVVSNAGADANDWGEAAIRRFLAEPGAHLAFIEAVRGEGGERGGGL